MTMHEHSADVYDALCAHLDYEGANSRLRGLVGDLVPDAASLLDVACGTGRHLELLAPHYEVEGLDLSPQMLDVARTRCPNARLHEGDLVDFSLDRTFDVVCCLFGSIGYAGSVANLDRAISRLAVHVRPGGGVVVEPWVAPERFREGKLVYDSVRDDDLNVARMYVTRQVGRASVYEMDYIVGTPSGVTHFAEYQELGLFTDHEYRQAFARAGLELADTDVDLFGYGLYAARANG